VATLMPGREVHLAREIAYTHPEKVCRIEIGVGRRVAHVSAENSRIADALLSEIDGIRTAREIFQRLTASGWTMEPGDFLELLECLSRHHGVLEMRAV
jgi:hypothetical protein